jgi:hypothetical protein
LWSLILLAPRQGTSQFEYVANRDPGFRMVGNGKFGLRLVNWILLSKYAARMKNLYVWMPEEFSSLVQH